jgi:hypothetical protein
MNFVSLNKADNISLSDAQAFVNKMKALGVPFGPLHVDETEGVGGTVSSFVPITELPGGELKPDGKYCIQAFSGRDFHKIASLKMHFDAREPISGFQSVCDEVGYTNMGTNVLLGIPGVNAAIAKLIAKA